MPIEIVFMDGMPEMPGTPREELTKTFGEVACAAYDFGAPGLMDILEEKITGKKKIWGVVQTSTIPNLYHLGSSLPMEEQMRRHENGQPVLAGVRPLQGWGRTEEESVLALYNQAARFGMAGTLRFLQTKDDQLHPPIVVGQGYEPVRSNHPRHDHNDPDIVNFISVHFDPFLGFVKGSLDTGHSHLLLK